MRTTNCHGITRCNTIGWKIMSTVEICSLKALYVIGKKEVLDEITWAIWFIKLIVEWCGTDWNAMMRNGEDTITKKSFLLFVFNPLLHHCSKCHTEKSQNRETIHFLESCEKLKKYFVFTIAFNALASWWSSRFPQ